MKYFLIFANLKVLVSVPGGGQTCNETHNVIFILWLGGPAQFLSGKVNVKQGQNDLKLKVAKHCFFLVLLLIPWEHYLFKNHGLLFLEVFSQQKILHDEDWSRYWPGLPWQWELEHFLSLLGVCLHLGSDTSDNSSGWSGLLGFFSTPENISHSQQKSRLSPWSLHIMSLKSRNVAERSSI